MGKYDINYRGPNIIPPYNDRLSEILLPFKLRKSRLLSLLWCINTPVRRLLGEFRAYRRDMDYRMEHTGQRIVLQHVLREKLSNNNINVVDSFNYQEEFVPPSADGELINYQFHVPADSSGVQILIGNRHTYNEYENFKVEVPSGFTDQQKMLVADLVDLYKIAGKTYKIVTI